MLVIKRNRGERAMLFCKGVCIGWIGRNPFNDLKINLEVVDDLTIIREEIMDPAQKTAFAKFTAERKGRAKARARA